METQEVNRKKEVVEKKPLEKVCIICAKGSLEDVYAHNLSFFGVCEICIHVGVNKYKRF